MRLTDRDRRLLEDIALHQVMTRDHLIRLGYFTSVQRANMRLLKLTEAGFLKRIELHPALESRQLLYAATIQAAPWLDLRVGALLSARKFTPMLVDHALAVLEVRLKLIEQGMGRWLSEPQIRHRYELRKGATKQVEDFRPDGLARLANRWLFIEVDRGHVSLPRIKEKLSGYGRYLQSGLFAQVYGQQPCALLIATTGRLRAKHLKRLASAADPVSVFVQTLDSLAVPQ